MGVGDQVKIKDGSFMITVANSKLSEHGGYTSTNHIGLCKDDFTVIAVNMKLPVGESINVRTNDTIIVHNPTGEVWFCSEGRNLISNSVPTVELTVSEISKRLGYEVKIVK